MSLQIVRDIIAKMQAPSDDGSNKAPMREGDVSELILIDRESDLITPMLTQLTYEGLIDEIFRIRNSKSCFDLIIFFIFVVVVMLIDCASNLVTPRVIEEAYAAVWNTISDLLLFYNYYFHYYYHYYYHSREEYKHHVNIDFACTQIRLRWMATCSAGRSNVERK